MNAEDRVTILEEEVLALKSSIEFIYKITNDETRINHLVNNIDHFMSLFEQSTIHFNQFKRASKQIQDVYDIANSFDELYGIEKKAKEILMVLGAKLQKKDDDD